MVATLLHLIPTFQIYGNYQPTVVYIATPPLYLVKKTLKRVIDGSEEERRQTAEEFSSTVAKEESINHAKVWEKNINVLDIINEPEHFNF